MGKVFTWDEIREGVVPTLVSFGAVAERTREILSRELSVLAAVLCGSVLWGTHTRRSDIDCVLVFKSSERRQTEEAIRELLAFAKKHAVPLELSPLDDIIAGTPAQHIGVMFARHLRRAAEFGGRIKGDLFHHISFDGIRPLEDIRSYLRFKLRALEIGAFDLPFRDTWERARHLERVLDTPAHVARRMLEWRGAALEDDSKSAVYAQYRRMFDGAAAELLDMAIAANQQYEMELARQFVFLNPERYERALTAVEAATQPVREFVRLNALILEGATI